MKEQSYFLEEKNLCQTQPTLVFSSFFCTQTWKVDFEENKITKPTPKMLGYFGIIWTQNFSRFPQDILRWDLWQSSQFSKSGEKNSQEIPITFHCHHAISDILKNEFMLLHNWFQPNVNPMSTQTNIKVFQRLLFLVPILCTIVGNIGT